jgi:apolipoprotein D and lipocalin family protein
MRCRHASAALHAALVVVGAFAGACSTNDNGRQPPTVVPRVDLSRYAGLWYEVARIPNRFQDQCAHSATARYRLLEDGRIRVINRCINRAGEPDEARGVARVVDEDTNAKLEVSFVRFLGWHLFWGDYWIIGLDPDYHYAVIGTPSRRYGWVLSRTPQLPPGARSRIDALLRDQGYNPQRFEASPQ